MQTFAMENIQVSSSIRTPQSLFWGVEASLFNTVSWKSLRFFFFSLYNFISYSTRLFTMIIVIRNMRFQISCCCFPSNVCARSECCIMCYWFTEMIWNDRTKLFIPQRPCFRKHRTSSVISCHFLWTHTGWGFSTPEEQPGSLKPGFMLFLMHR